MPGKANIKRRKRAAQGRKAAAAIEQLKRMQKFAEEKGNTDFVEELESRSSIVEEHRTMLPSHDCLNQLLEGRET